jgi:hypothetical protein
MEAASRKQQALVEHQHVREDLLRETENKTLSKSLKRRNKKEKKKLYKKMGGPPPKPTLDPELIIEKRQKLDDGEKVEVK